MGFSIPNQFEKQIRDHLAETGKTTSEFIREALSSYFKQHREPQELPTNMLSERDLDRVLEIYYDLIGMHQKEVMVIGLGIIEKDGKVLIEKRSTTDKHVKDLHWVFPGGKMESLDFRSEIQKDVKEETNLDIDVKDIIHARLIPDSPNKEIKIVALYFHCKPTSDKERSGKEVSELKWVKPTAVCQYFTTSTCDTVMRFLGSLER